MGQAERRSRRRGSHVPIVTDRVARAAPSRDMMCGEMPVWSKRTRRWWAGRDPLVIHAYPGFGTREKLWVRGRVLDDEGLSPAAPGASAWRNLRDAWKRFETDERPRLRVRSVFQGRSQETVTDEEGFFEFLLQPAEPLPADRSWHDVELSLADGGGRHPAARATARVLVPSARARVGVISDIDDTIIQTGATQMLRAVRAVLLGSAHPRLPFPGVAPFYRALESGAAGKAANPFFYVSSSPWNLYDVLLEVMELHGLPPGPLLLRDWGLAREAVPFRHRSHKLPAIRRIAELYPGLPLLLVGDSGPGGKAPAVVVEARGLKPDGAS